jgi:hypothetical protein
MEKSIEYSIPNLDFYIVAPIKRWVLLMVMVILFVCFSPNDDLINLWRKALDYELEVCELWILALGCIPTNYWNLDWSHCTSLRFSQL